ncbi:MAG: hypothetical protein LBS89_06995, partial [Zoogloeaceae bacterium]|nr:hypothetical protein [Zoogloeaceae bacterium]
RPVVVALAKSLVEAYDWTHAHSEEAAKIFLKYTTNITQSELRDLYKQLTLHQHPFSTDLRDQLEFYIDDFKDLGVLKASTDTKKFAEHIFAKVI